jgi:[acyl-carrier-protein] S-malonyltransferase
MEGGLLEEAGGVFEEATRVLGVDIVELCRTGTTDRASLASTRWAQPAVLTCGVAGFAALSGRERFTAVAGHSVGEYAALVACGAIGLADGLALISLRARITSEAASATPGGMAALMRIEPGALDAIRSRTGVALAADNAPGHYVISGPTENLTEAIRLIEEAGGKCRRLEVDGAFHSPVMASAKGALADALDSTKIVEPAIEFWSSTTASILTKPAEIREALVAQLTEGVRWRETVSGAAERHGTALLDIGPGKVVGALARRVVPAADIRYVADLLPIGGDAA